jgi:hypothetical protein
MRIAYRVLAFVVAAEVAIQAVVMVWAVAGLGKWVAGGGVLDAAVMESGGTPFPEVIGFLVHGINGWFVIPGIALLLLIASFFTRVRGAIKWALLVLALVVVQTQLGFIGHEIPAVGGLHGLNALILFLAALYAGMRIGKASRTDASASASASASAEQVGGTGTSQTRVGR